MSSNCPPQLHLSLPPNTTSFKRSFEQFGFDLESPVGGGTEGAAASGSDGNDRSKRARSASSFSDDSDSFSSSQSSTVASSSSRMSTLAENEVAANAESSLSAAGTPILHGATHYPLSLTRLSQEPPRLPTPEIQDIEMADYPLAEAIDSTLHSPPAAAPPSSSQADESYRLSLERFNAFDSQISALRRSRSPSLVRSPTSPPVLPPLELLGDQARLSTNGIPFMHPPAQPSSPPLPDSLYSFGLPLLNRTPRSGTASTSQDESRIPPHGTQSQGESSTSQRPQRQSSNRMSNTSRSMPQEVGPSSQGDPHSESMPWIEFSPDTLWSRYDESPSPTSDDQEFEFTEFRGDLAPALGGLRTPSPLFEDLDDLRPSARQVETHPPTLPPIHDTAAWGDPLEDLVAYSSNTPRTESVNPRVESSASSSRPVEQPVLNRISTRDLPPTRSGEGRSTSSSDNDQNHSLPSPFLSNLGGWMENDNSTLFGLSTDWSTRDNTDGTSSGLVSRDGAGPSRPSGNRGGVDWLWHPPRDSLPINSAQQLSRDSSISRTIGDDARLSAWRAMLSSDHRAASAQASGAVSAGQEQNVHINPGRLTPPLLNRMEPWLSDRGRDRDRNRDNHPPERPHASVSIYGVSDDLSSSSRDIEAYDTELTSTNTRNHANISRQNMGTSTTYESEVDSFNTRNPSNGRRNSLSVSWRSVFREATPPPLIPMSTSPLFYDSSITLWDADGDDEAPPPQRTAPAPRVSPPRGTVNISQTTSEQPGSSRPPWSWDDNITIEVEDGPPAPPSVSPPPLPPTASSSATSPNASSSFPATDLLRLRSRLYNSSHRPTAISTNTNSSTDFLSRYAREFSRGRAVPTPIERRADPQLSSYSSINRRRHSPPTERRAESQSTWRNVPTPIEIIHSPPTERRAESQSTWRNVPTPIEVIHSPPTVRRAAESQSLWRNVPTPIEVIHSPPTVRRTEPQFLWRNVPTPIERRADPQVEVIHSPPPAERRAESQFDPMASPYTFINSRRHTPPSRPLEIIHQRERADVSARQRDLPTRLGENTSSSPMETSNLIDHAMEVERSAGPSRDSSIARLAEYRPHVRLTSPPPSPRRLYRREPTVILPAGRVNEHRRSQSLIAELRHDINQISAMNDAANGVRRHQDSGEFSSRSSFELLEVPSLPSPSLGEIFDQTEQGNDTDRSRRVNPPSGPSIDMRSTRVPLSHHTFFPARRRSPSPTREEQLLRRGRSPPRRSSPPVSRRINAESFAPGPFRNTVQGFFTTRAMRGPMTARTVPPTIPPLAFEVSGGVSSQRDNSNSQASRTRLWLSNPSNFSQPPTPSHPDDSPSSEHDEWSWDEPIRQSNMFQHRTNASRPSLPHSNDSSRRQASVDVHNYLSRQARMEASRIEDPETTNSSSGGDVGGFSHAIEVLRQDGLNSTRSHQLITRFRREREQRNSESRNTSLSGSLSSPWGIIDPAPPTPSGSRLSAETSRDPLYWRSRLNAGTTEASTAQHRTFGGLGQSNDIDQHTRARRIRFARHDLGSMFVANGPVQDYLGRIGRRGRAIGDYMRDEDFDESYESLLSLAATLGEAKPRATPDDIIAGMETGLYKNWKTPDSDHRCPICLDDYQPDDALLKLTDCSHWLHRECLQQWLKGASTCPVCRKTVNTTRRPQNCHSHEASSSSRRNGAGGGPSGSGSSGTFGSAGGDRGSRSEAPGGNDWPPPWRYGQ